jgi:FkbM family methyltransferase
MASRSRWLPILLCLAFPGCYRLETPQVKPETAQPSRPAVAALDLDLYEVPGLGKFYLEKRDDVVQDTLKSGRIWELHHQVEFEKYVKPGMNVIDAGAYVGSHTVKLAKLAAPGKVYTFEPQRDMYQLLKKNLEINDISNAVVFPTALGDRECFTEIMVLTSAATNKGANPMLGCVPFDPDASQMKMKTLDSYRLENISFMKIDVEASEAILIEGGRETIRRSMPVMLIEISSGYVNTRFTHHSGSSKSITIPMLEELGYSVTHLWGDDYLATPR